MGSHHCQNGYLSKTALMFPKYSVVIPVYNEETNLEPLYQRLTAMAEGLDGELEMIFVNDGSRDRTLAILRDLHHQDQRLCYLSLSRNFGHQIAVTAGLNFTRGSAIAIMDGDLQDPPELIPVMVAQWQQGYQVIYAQRRQRLQEKWWKQLPAYLFYRLLQRLTEIKIPNDTGDFCLMDRAVVDILNQMPERNRYLRGLRAWVGLKQTAIYFNRDPRLSGEVKYTFAKSLSLALNGIFSFSKLPLRLATYLGLIAAAVALGMGCLVFYWRLVAPNSPLTGFATILIAIFFLGAVQLVSIGILGEYIGRIYEEVKGRPLYILSEVAGFETTEHDLPHNE
jgi:glycosyltransferase involved in cell wall biosynthesis